MRPVLLAAVLGCLPLARALAQCPDGTPPPCRGSTSAAARRANPPLDERTWIILPFENVARVADIEWLQDASVNLLYLDMSKWRDIRVIDDERVADLIREVPEARGGLTLQSGIAVARRAGAGKLVMGDLLKVGNRTQVVAKVYDVRTGQRLRNVREETTNADSLMSLFGRLASGILNASAPSGASLGTGTTRLEAYQAYVAGVTALNRVELDSAATHFQRALALDSTFALAHYKVSVVYGWISAQDPRRVTHAELANRLAGGLPPRERQLILGQYQTSGGHWNEACQTYTALLRADSSDVEAWYNLGECNYHDQQVLAAAGDSTQLAFRSSWNTAMRAFQRALELDPSYHLAYSHIPDILLVERRIGCRSTAADANCQPPHVARVLRHADTLVTIPVLPTDLAALARQGDSAVAQAVWRTNLQQNRVFAQAWVNAGPAEPRAHIALARALLRSGNIGEASREFALARARPTQLTVAEANRLIGERFEVLFKLDSLQAVARLADSLDARPGRTNLDQAGLTAIVLGRWRQLDAVLGGNFQGPPQVRRALLAAFKTMQGAPPEDLAAIELGLDSVIGSAPDAQRSAARQFFFMATMPWTLSMARPASLRDMDTSSADLKTRMTYQMIRGDTVAARATIRRLDAEVLASARDLPSAVPLQLVAEGYLWLGDTATALARLRDFEARLPYLNPQGTYIIQLNNLTTNMQTWGRTFLRLADAAAQTGDRATAARNYRRVVDLWSSADAAFQPTVQRAREALARLGS